MVAFLQRHRWWLFGLIAAGGLIVFFERWRVWRENSHDPAILAAAARHGVNPALVKAVVWRESRFNPRARGRAGELGLMQIREPAARDWAKAGGMADFQFADLAKPGTNLFAGAWYLGRLLHRYRHTDNPAVFALAAYNAGPTTASRWATGAGSTNSAVFLRQMTYPGTRKYVEAVLRREERYRRQLRLETSDSGRNKAENPGWNGQVARCPEAAIESFSPRPVAAGALRIPRASARVPRLWPRAARALARPV